MLLLSSELPAERRLKGQSLGPRRLTEVVEKIGGRVLVELGGDRVGALDDQVYQACGNPPSESCTI